MLDEKAVEIPIAKGSPPSPAKLAMASESGPTAEEVARLLEVVPPNVFRFLTGEFPEDYMAIAYVLYWNRRYGLNEIHHDDLRHDAEGLTLALTGRSLEEERFQSMVDNLFRWRAIERRLATPAIRSIHDWRRNYTQYWLSESAYRLFDLLEYGRGLVGRQLSSAEGRDYLRMIDQRLEELADKLDALTTPQTDAEALERNEAARQIYHALTLLHTNEFRQFKDFLSDLNAALIEFGRRPEVDLNDLPHVRGWLEAYVRDMLVFFRERSNRIVKSAGRLRDSPHTPLLQVGYELALEAATTPLGRPTPLSHPPPERTLFSFIQFFEKRQGLDQQARRIKESTAETMRRLDEHFQRLAEVSHVLDLLRLRTSEMLAIDPANEKRVQDTQRWLARLFAPTPVLFAPRIGPSTDQGEPPRPGRYRENRRPPIQDAKIRRAQGDAAGALRVDAERANRINAFVEGKILKGRDEAELHGLQIETLEEFRTLLAAVKYDTLLLASPISRHFTFTVHDTRRRPADLIPILEWSTQDAIYTGPNLTFRRKRPAPTNELIIGGGRDARSREPA